MRSLRNDLGDECVEEVSDLLVELVNVTIKGARTSINDEDFADYRRSLNEEYCDAVYRVIMMYRKNRRKK